MVEILDKGGKVKLEDLNNYIDDRKNYLDEVNEILTALIPKDEPEIIKEHLTLILAHRATISTMLAKLEKMLDEALATYLPIKEKSDTDLDRKYNLDSKVADFRYWRNLIEGLLKTIDLQVSSMQSLLSFEKKHLSQLTEVTP